MAYEVMTGMINLDELEVKSNTVAEISAGSYYQNTIHNCPNSRSCGGGGVNTVWTCAYGHMIM